jgi:type I restriction enzyme S subunit
MTVRERLIGDLEREGFILDIQDGNHGEIHPKASDYVDFGVPFVMASDILDGHVEVAQCSRITEQQARGLRKGFAVDRDVLLTHKGTIGSTALVRGADPYWVLTPQVTYYRVDASLILPEFLNYAFRMPRFKKQMVTLADQATRPYIGITAQRKLKVAFADIKTQDLIVQRLSPYDDLIENNKRRIKLLEEAARLIYREWFVRLRFPGHQHTKIEAGIPEGWRRVSICETGTVLTGKTPSTKNGDFYGGDIPFIKTPDMHGCLIVDSTASTLTQRGSAEQDNKLLPPWSILVSCIGTVGVVAMNARPSQFNQQINALIPSDAKTRYYSYFAFGELKPLLEGLSGGATMPNVSKAKFERLPLLLPKLTKLEEFNILVEPMFCQILSLQRQIVRLSEARDLLLPRLMSGEIEV